MLDTVITRVGDFTVTLLHVIIAAVVIFILYYYMTASKEEEEKTDKEKKEYYSSRWTPSYGRSPIYDAEYMRGSSAFLGQKSDNFMVTGYVGPEYSESDPETNAALIKGVYALDDGETTNADVAKALKQQATIKAAADLSAAKKQYMTNDIDTLLMTSGSLY